MSSQIYTFIANISIIAGVIISFLATTKSNDHALRTWLATGALLSAIHLWLIHLPIPCMIVSIFGIQQLVLIRIVNKTAILKIIAFITFEILYIIIYVSTWKNISSFIQLSTLLITTYGFFYLTGPARKKQIYIIWGLILLNTWVSMSIKQALITTLILIVNILIFNILRKKVKIKNKQKELIVTN